MPLHISPHLGLKQPFAACPDNLGRPAAFLGRAEVNVRVQPTQRVPTTWDVPQLSLEE